jgi:CheY-like chemotaxis protein/HPt (histidine-containing phosphotransfer) domain-containing protein
MLLNDILDFSKIEAGRLALEEVDFELQETVEEVGELLAITARQKKLELSCFVSPALPAMFAGDPGRLRQVLTNLIGNAIKFTERGEVALRVEHAGEREGRTLVRFEVADTGIGVPPEARGRLFQPFSQADTSTTRRYGGTGLGLVICKRLVELMGGEIGFESEVGKGSTFRYTVPIAPRPGVGRGAQGMLATPGTVRVLCVDDNATNRLIIERLGRSWGLEVESAGTGAEALARLRSGRDDRRMHQVVIADLLMPGMDGIELTQRIKRDPELTDVAVVVLTSLGMRDDLERAKAAGADGCLTKPARASSLHATLRVLLAQDASPPVRAEPEPVRQPVPPRAPLAARGLHVLLVEDNAVNQAIATRQLQRLGLTVDVANDGRAAVEAVAAKAYDLVFMDCQMPIMSGYEATGEIRRREAGTGRHVTVIAMTANAMAGDREECLRAGMDDYVAKPVKIDVLQAMVERWAPTAAVEPAAPAPAAPRTDAEPVVDAAALDELRSYQVDGEPDVLDALIGKFLDSARRECAEVRAAVGRGDAEMLRRVAHGLKGSSGMFGARRLSAISSQIEMLSRQGSLGDAGSLVSSLEEELEAVARVLEAERRSA